MNTTLLIEYFETSMKFNHATETRSIDEENAYDSRLEQIWYHEFTETERYLSGLFLKRADSTNPKIDINDTLQKIINSLKENTYMTNFNIFETKEEYLNFKEFWKKFHAEKRYNKVPEEFKRYDYIMKDIVVAGIHMKSPLTNIHHMIYLAATGKSLDKALGKISSSKINELKVHINWAIGRFKVEQPTQVDYYFKLFKNSIDSKYYKNILEKIMSYLNSKNV